MEKTTTEDLIATLCNSTDVALVKECAKVLNARCGLGTAQKFRSMMRISWALC